MCLPVEELPQERERLLGAVAVPLRQVHVVQPQQQPLAERWPVQVLAALVQHTLKESRSCSSRKTCLSLLKRADNTGPCSGPYKSTSQQSSIP